MLKKLYIMIFVSLLAVSLQAQQGGQNIPYAPQKGNFQVDMLIGPSSFFFQSNYSGLSYLLPSDVQNDGSIEDMGLDGNDMKYYFNLGSLNTNTLSNMIGVRGSYFILDELEINAMFAMNINLTPKKDFVEGDFTISEMPIPNYKYVLGETNHTFNVEMGLNYRFKLPNERISPYIGAYAGFMMARVETVYPYTGETLSGDPIELYRSTYRAGQEYAIRAGFMAGIDFAVLPGFIIGLEVAPASYQYSVVDIRPTGLSPFQADDHFIRIFSQPRIKFGFRF
jgi:hypothetical protein